MIIVLIFCYCLLIVVDGEDAELFRNRKDYFSLNTVQLIVDVFSTNNVVRTKDCTCYLRNNI